MNTTSRKLLVLGTRIGKIIMPKEIVSDLISITDKSINSNEDFGYALAGQIKDEKVLTKKDLGPTWSNLPWPIDTDLDPIKGDSALKESLIFIAPGNCLGLPSVALPMGVADGLPTGIQIYSELYREDLCLLAAEIIESERDCPTPIDPVK